MDRKPYLAETRVADVVADALRFRHGRSAEIYMFCVMPDHLHVLFSLGQPGRSLSRWVGDFKRWVDRELRIRGGLELRWQPNFFERVVRDDKELSTIAEYILLNPVRQGLVSRWQDYTWCGSLVWQLEK